MGPWGHQVHLPICPWGVTWGITLKGQFHMYGTFPSNFCKAIAPFIKGQRLVDLGSGDMGRTDVLRLLDPAVILAVDKEPRGPAPELHPTIIPLQGYFKDVLKTIEVFAPTVAHIAWPINNPMPGLIEILELVPTVVYVGCNTDGSSCGDIPLFKYMLTRALTLYLPEQQNSLIVLGGKLKTPRSPTPEEDAALNQYTGKIRPFKP